MGLINFKDIDFKQSINKELKTFDFNGSEIGVVPYLSINDKYDLVMITLQKSFEKGIYNHVKLDMYFDLHLVYMYTNIQFDNEDRVNEAELYDILKQSGLLDKVIENIDKEEIEILYSYIYEMVDVITKYHNTLGSVLNAFIDQLPQNMDKAAKIIDTLDLEKYGNFSNLAAQIKADFPNLLAQEKE